MSRNIPFFEFFAGLPASPELRLRLAGAELTHGLIDRGELSIQLDMTVKTPLEPETLREAEEALKAAYGFQKVELNAVCAALPPAAPAPASQGGGGSKAAPKKKPGKVLMGNPVKARPGPMSALNVKMGTATVSGKVFAFECRETRRPGMWRLSFDMTDGTGSVTVQKNHAFVNEFKHDALLAQKAAQAQLLAYGVGSSRHHAQRVLVVIFQFNGHVEYADQRPLSVHDRRGGTAPAGGLFRIVLAPDDFQRLALHEAGADAVGAVGFFRGVVARIKYDKALQFFFMPHGMNNQPGFVRQADNAA